MAGPIRPTRRSVGCLILLAAVGGGPLDDSVSAGPEAPMDSTVASLADAERAFSTMSVERGMTKAFVAYLRDDAVLFRPGPINGKQLWLKRGDIPATLIWEPSYGEVAASGDFGLSLGPSEFRPQASESKDEVGHGHFVSIWCREEQGPWRVAVDIGISHPAPPTGGLGHVTFTAGPRHTLPSASKRSGGFGVGLGVGSSGFGFGIGTGSGGTIRDEEHRRTAHAIHTMMSAERSLGFAWRTKGGAQAYQKHASGDLRHFRNGAQPTLGIDAAVEATAQRPRGQGVASSWDLGYSYGLVLTRAKGASPDTASYMHVWRKDPSGDWKLALDIENEFPKR